MARDMSGLFSRPHPQKLCEHIIECLLLDNVLHDVDVFLDFNVALWSMKRQWLDVWNVIFSRPSEYPYKSAA